MISEVVMPQMGADMTEGTLLRWIKHEGDTVKRGEIIAEIETDKANVEIEAFEAGVFRKTLASEGDVIPVGGIIAVIADAADDISKYANGTAAPPAPQPPPASPSSQGPPSTPPAAMMPTAAPIPSPAPAARAERAPVPAPTADVQRPGLKAAAAPAAGTGSARIRVSPVARRVAEDNGIDVRALRGSGPDGRIIRRDVEAAMSSRGAAAATGTTPKAAAPAAAAGPITQSKMRQAIARRMSQSKREAPHYYLLADIDMTDASAFRGQLNETLAASAHVSINDLIVRASALALQAYPDLNVTYSGEELVRHDRQNVCIAIALDEGLIAPAIIDAGGKSLVEIAAASADLVARAKGGRMRPEEINDGTFTITNLGAYGIETLIGIIQPPQTAILGVGSAMEAPAARDGAVVVRKVMKVALSADHRVTDGAYGARFVAELKRILEHPLLLIL